MIGLALTKEQKEKFVNLQDKIRDKVAVTMHLYQESEAALEMEVQPGTWSSWHTKNKSPSMDSVLKLADRLYEKRWFDEAKELFEITGVPRVLPRDKRVAELLDIYSDEDEDGGREMIEHAKNVRDRRRVTKGKLGVSQTA